MSFTWGPFGPLNLALDVLIAATGAGAASWAWRRRGLPGAAAALALACLAWLPMVPLLGVVLGGSLVSRAAWTTATVALPALLLALAWARRAPAAALGALLLLGAKYYGEVWEPSRLEVERLELRLAGLRAPLRVVHLSDLQTDEFWSLHESVRREANAFDPDVVVFTGDAINHPSLAEQASRWLAGFTHREGKYFVSGDVDGGYDVDAMLRAGGFVRLDGKALLLPRSRLGLLGVAVHDAWNEAGIASLAASLGDAPKVLLSHRPDAVFAAAKGAAQLVLAGHTHGGQVCAPLLGPIVTLTRVARKIAAGGLHRHESARIVVSRGLGWEGHVAPRVRAFCRPHLLLLELKPGQPGDPLL